MVPTPEDLVNTYGRGQMAVQAATNGTPWLRHARGPATSTLDPSQRGKVHPYPSEELHEKKAREAREKDEWNRKWQQQEQARQFEATKDSGTEEEWKPDAWSSQSSNWKGASGWSSQPSQGKTNWQSSSEYWPNTHSDKTAWDPGAETLNKAMTRTPPLEQAHVRTWGKGKSAEDYGYPAGSKKGKKDGKKGPDTRVLDKADIDADFKGRMKTAGKAAASDAPNACSDEWWEGHIEEKGKKGLGKPKGPTIITGKGAEVEEMSREIVRLQAALRMAQKGKPIGAASPKGSPRGSK